MKKNIKILIGVLLLLVIFGIILFNKLLNNDIVFIDKTNINSNIINDEELKQEVVLYNQILKESQSIDDIKKCKQFKIEDIKNTCISSIKVKFGDMAQAKTLEDCEELEATETSSKELRVDVCKYNLIKKMNKEDINFEELCGQIIDKDVKYSCLANFGK